jgi:hypothetical protein
MKRIRLFLVLVFAFAFLPAALTRAADISGTVSSKVLPRYVSGDGTLVYSDAVVQSEAIISYNNFYFDLWGSKGLGEDGYGNEVDVFFGYAGKHFDAGIVYFDIEPVFTEDRTDIVCPYAKIFTDIGGGFKPFAKLELYVPADWQTSLNTSRSQAGMQHSWQIVPSIALNQTLAVVYATSHSERNGWIGHYCVGLSAVLGKGISLDIANDLYLPLNSTSRNFQVIPVVGFTYSF